MAYWIKLKMNWFKKGLKKTSKQLSIRLREVFGGSSKLSSEDYDAVEEILLGADLGPQVVFSIIAQLRDSSTKVSNLDQLLEFLESEITSLFDLPRDLLNENPNGPTVLLVVGVNGTGKTTTLAKLAHHLKEQNKQILFASCDTFRAAATDQLKIWADRLNVEVVHKGMGADPAAVVFDALKAAQSRKVDYLLCDTAGRLHNKAPLMDEIKKMARVLNKELPGAPHEVLLVLDATTGQNGFAQAKKFQEALDLTGIVVSKLDGTAKGGVVVSIEKELKIPIKFVGLGESINDFAPFSPQEYVQALLKNENGQ